MKITEHADLKPLNSFNVPARATNLITIESEEDIPGLPGLNPAQDYVLGGGSNVLFLDDVPGVLYQVGIAGKEIIRASGDDCIVAAGAGENWHDLVCWSLEQGLHGLENLSLIPGLAGAAPYQNIGAYGVELSEVLESVTAWDWRHQQFVEIPAIDCGLAYRDSRFKSAERNRFLITSIRLRLSRNFQPRLEYAGLRQQLSAMGHSEPTATDVAHAVIVLRQEKLPDWRTSPNAGSFFKNPAVSADRLASMQLQVPDIPYWQTADGAFKIPAARLIEAAGLKGYCMGPVAVSERHALVLVNTGGACGRDIQALAMYVQKTVAEQWGVNLEPEIQMIKFQQEAE